MNDKPPLDLALPRAEVRAVAPSPPPVPPSERRASPRYSPDPLVPVFFAHPDAETPTAGLVADVSDGGARIVAPPTARPMLHWSDPLAIVISYSDSARASGIEGLRLDGHVVRLAVDATGYTLHVRFDRNSGDWSKLQRWIEKLGGR